LLCHWAADAEKGSWTRYTPKLTLFIILAARWGGIIDMSRWRHILSASPPSLSACPKPTVEKRHDPSPTNNEIKNDNISCAGLLSAYALRSRRKAVAKISAQRGIKASPLITPIRANATCFCRLVHLGIASQSSCSSPTALRFCRRQLRAWLEMEEPLLGVG
jgi:hypothetical protein